LVEVVSEVIDQPQMGTIERQPVGVVCSQRDASHGVARGSVDDGTGQDEQDKCQQG